MVCSNKSHYQYIEECLALLSMKGIDYLTIENNSGGLSNVVGADVRRGAIDRARLFNLRL